MNIHDAHKILGTNSQNTWEEIKKQYRTLAKQHHPDKVSRSDLIVDINEAHRILEIQYKQTQEIRNSQAEEDLARKKRMQNIARKYKRSKQRKQEKVRQYQRVLNKQHIINSFENILIGEDFSNSIRTKFFQLEEYIQEIILDEHSIPRSSYRTLADSRINTYANQDEIFKELFNSQEIDNPFFQTNLIYLTHLFENKKIPINQIVAFAKKAKSENLESTLRATSFAFLLYKDFDEFEKIARNLNYNSSCSVESLDKLLFCATFLTGESSIANTSKSNLLLKKTLSHYTLDFSEKLLDSLKGLKVLPHVMNWANKIDDVIKAQQQTQAESQYSEMNFIKLINIVSSIQSSSIGVMSSHLKLDTFLPQIAKAIPSNKLKYAQEYVQFITKGSNGCQRGQFERRDEWVSIFEDEMFQKYCIKPLSTDIILPITQLHYNKGGFTYPPYLILSPEVIMYTGLQLRDKSKEEILMLNDSLAKYKLYRHKQKKKTDVLEVNSQEQTIFDRLQYIETNKREDAKAKLVSKKDIDYILNSYFN